MNSEALKKKKRVIPQLRGTIALRYSQLYAVGVLLVGGILGIPLHLYWTRFLPETPSQKEDIRFKPTVPSNTSPLFKSVIKPSEK